MNKNEKAYKKKVQNRSAEELTTMFEYHGFLSSFYQPYNSFEWAEIKKRLKKLEKIERIIINETN